MRGDEWNTNEEEQKKSTRCRVQITKTTKIGKKIVVLICLLILFCLLLRRWSFSSLFAHAFFFVRVCILSAALMNSSRFFLISSILFIAFVAAKLTLFFQLRSHSITSFSYFLFIAALLYSRLFSKVLLSPSSISFLAY